MEVFIDKLISELKVFTSTPSDEGGCSDILPVASIYFGDPGMIPVSLYPAVTVEPEEDRLDSVTTGYDTRELKVCVSFHIDARNFFDLNEEEAMGDRILVVTMQLLRRWFEKRSNRTLDGLVKNLSVEKVKYMKYLRGEVVTKSAEMSLVAQKSYIRVLD